MAYTNSYAQSSNPRNRPGYCPIIENKTCEEGIKSLMPSWDYNEQYELNKITYSCAANDGMKCINYVSKNLPGYDKNNLEDLTKIALSCQLTNLSCMDFLKTKLSSFNFSDIDKVTSISRACARTDLSCLKKKCNSREYNCRDAYDAKNAAKSCYKLCD